MQTHSRDKVRPSRISFRVVRRNQPLFTRLLTTPKEVANLARELIPDDGREHFITLFLDSALHILGWHEVGIGTANEVISNPRDIFGAALRTPDCIGIICAHNHPSGLAKPSKQDRMLTRTLLKAGKVLDMRVHDHVIVTHVNRDYFSFNDARLIAY